MYAVILVLLGLIIFPPIGMFVLLLLLFVWNPIVTILGIAFIVWLALKLDKKYGKKGRR